MTTTTQTPGSALISSVSFAALEAQRDAIVNELKTMRDALARIHTLRAGSTFDYQLPSIKVEVDGVDFYPDHLDTFDASAIESIDRVMWRFLFKASNVDTIMTAQKREQLSAMLYPNQRRRSYNETVEPLPPLTEANVLATFAAIHSQAGNYFEESVEAVYRSLSWNHKTNSPLAFGRKAIIRGACDISYATHQATFKHGYHSGRIADLELVLCHIAGVPPATHQSGLRSIDLAWGEWVDVPGTVEGVSLLRVKCYHNQNVHIEIKNQSHVDEMNRIIAKRFPGSIATSKRKES